MEQWNLEPFQIIYNHLTPISTSNNVNKYRHGANTEKEMHEHRMAQPGGEMLDPGGRAIYKYMWKIQIYI